MSSELRNNRLDIGVQNEIVCRTRESYEHGTWMTAFTTVRNAELKGETAEEHTGKYRIFLSSSVVVGRRPTHRKKRNREEAKMIMTGTQPVTMDWIAVLRNPQDHVSSTL